MEFYTFCSKLTTVKLIGACSEESLDKEMATIANPRQENGSQRNDYSEKPRNNHHYVY
jgi:hypothetical protein